MNKNIRGSDPTHSALPIDATKPSDMIVSQAQERRNSFPPRSQEGGGQCLAEILSMVQESLSKLSQTLKDSAQIKDFVSSRLPKLFLLLFLLSTCHKLHKRNLFLLLPTDSCLRTLSKKSSSSFSNVRAFILCPLCCLSW